MNQGLSGGCLDKLTRDMPVPRSFSVAGTQAMTEKIRDGPNAPFNKRLVCGVPNLLKWSDAPCFSTPGIL